jgi:hypothetical protein
MKNNTIYLIPIGGLGNRIRFLGSIFAQSGIKDKNIVVINFVTNMFPAKLDEVFDIELENCSIINIRVPSEKLVILLLRLFCCLSLLTFRKVAKYATRKYSKRNIVLAGHNRMTGYKIKFINPKRRSGACIKMEHYNSVHIRRSDNKRAIENNSLETFYEFIKQSNLPVFLATDDQNLKLKISQLYPIKVFTLDTNLSRASKQNLIDAVDEIHLLSQSVLFLGSTGSSFSTLVYEIRGDYE